MFQKHLNELFADKNVKSISKFLFLYKLYKLAKKNKKKTTKAKKLVLYLLKT